MSKAKEVEECSFRPLTNHPIKTKKSRRKKSSVSQAHSNKSNKRQMTIENVDDAMIIINTLSENLDTDRINENA